ncbi:thioredoxin domain-containing protein 5-like [Mytilus galloprovincialis]|uniref:thioredoxin domain-containing protein 5-like n=1 Tax=Mytilus galloprovincialis TaxID=29158 RepID=UPI003F7B6E0D
MWKVGAVLLLVFSAVVTADNDDHGSEAVSHTADSFATQVEETKQFVMFFAPWCGHCKRLAPTWNELAKVFNDKEEQEVVIAKVDCTVETALCADNDVTGYPTIKFFSNGKDGAVRYKGGRDLEALQSFVEEQLGKGEEEKEEEEELAGPLYELNDKNFAGFTETGNHFIKFYAPWCGHCKRLAPIWEDLAKEFDEDDSPATISKVDCTVSQQLCSSHEVRGYPTLLFFKDGQKVEKYAGQRDLSSFKEFIKRMVDQEDENAEREEEKVPEKVPTQESENGVVELTAGSFKAAIDYGVTFVKFFAPWCGHCKRLAPTWEDLSKKYADIDSVRIAKVDCTLHKELCQERKVRGYPTLIVYKNGEMKEEYSGGRDLPSLETFLDKFVFTGDMKEELPSEIVEEFNSPVLDLDTASFQPTISEGVTFVKFFAPWCGHCKSLAPTWEDLSKRFEGEKTVKIAKVDCTVYKDICQANQVRGYPTLLMFKDGEKKEEYGGGRDLDSLSSFVEKHNSDSDRKEEL